MPITASSFETVGPAEDEISATGRIRYGWGTDPPGIARVGGAAAASPGMPGCGGGAPWVLQSPRGKPPSNASTERVNASSVGARDPPPPGNARRQVHGYRASIAGGSLVDGSFPAKQSAPEEGAAKARSASPLRRTTLSRTSFPAVGQRFRSRTGTMTMPYVR